MLRLQNGTQLDASIVLHHLPLEKGPKQDQQLWHVLARATTAGSRQPPRSFFACRETRAPIRAGIRPPELFREQLVRRTYFIGSRATELHATGIRVQSQHAFRAASNSFPAFSEHIAGLGGRAVGRFLPPSLFPRSGPPALFQVGLSSFPERALLSSIAQREPRCLWGQAAIARRARRRETS